MEYIDIVDEQGNPTGEKVERSIAHSQGICHRTAHIWIVRKVNGRYQVLMQKRAMNKESFPGMFDTSSAGNFRISYEKEFYGKMFRDNEIVFVYIYSQPVDETKLVLQKEEVETVEWFDLEEAYANCKKRDPRFCAPTGGIEIVIRELAGRR